VAEIKIFAGSANVQLAQQTAHKLNIPLGKAQIGRFSDGEITTEVLENVRGRDIFILQSTCPPVNDHIMELIIMADAFRRASAGSITAVVPYFGYARQDRRVRSTRVPISAKVIADMMATVGINRVITVDLHADQIQGFFAMPVDNVYATPVMLEDMRKRQFPDPMVVSPDVGGVVRARAIAKRLNDLDLAIIDKRRPRKNETKVMHIIGDVADRDCIIVDDMVDTAGTLCHAAQALKEHGATTVSAYCTHPVLSGDAVADIEASVLDEVVVTDSIPLSTTAAKCDKIRQLSISNIIAETIYRVNNQESVSAMFVEEPVKGGAIDS